MDSIPHGTFSGYNYHRCRCSDCRAVKAARNRQYGAERRAAGVECKIGGCGKTVSGKGAYCSAHAARIAKDGTAGDPVTRTNDGIPRTYSRAHNRLKEVRGVAVDHRCVDCGGPAADWSLKRDALNVSIQVGGKRDGLAFSSDPEDYEARCKLCHAAHDGYGGRRGAERDSRGRFVPAQVRDEPEP